MKIIGIITIYVTLLIVFCGCLETQLTTNYINEEFGIGIDPPENWIPQEYNNSRWIVGWQPLNNSSTFFVISKHNRLDEGLALSVFADDIEETFSEKYDNFSIQNRDWLTIGGLTAYEIEYIYTLNGSVIKEYQIAVKHTRDYYILKYCSTVSDYDLYFSIFNQSKKTFQLK